MARSPKQMIAIIMALKKKGLFGRLFGGVAKDLPSAGQLSHAKINLAGKQIPFAMSPKVAKASWGKQFSPAAVRSYLGKAPRKHIQESSLKGIYALDSHEFNRVMGGILRRTHTPEEIVGFRKALKQQFDIFAPSGLGLKPRILGVQQRGRIFVDAEQISKFVEKTKGLNPANKLVTMKQVRGEVARNIFLHEFGHHIDNPRSQLVAAAKGEQALLGLKGKSIESSFYEDLTTQPLDPAFPIARITAVESFAELYAAYAAHPFVLKLTNPQGYKAIKLFFEGR